MTFVSKKDPIEKVRSTMERLAQLQSELENLEKKKRRQCIFAVEDEIMGKHDSLIDALEKRLQQRTESEPLFTIRWQIV